MTKGVNTDLIAGVTGLLITGVFWFSIEFDISNLSIMFPKAVILIMALVSAALTVKGFVRASIKEIFSEGSNIRAMVTGAAFFAWGIAINYVGFFVTSVTAIVAIACYLALARRKITPGLIVLWVVVALVEVTFFYLIFTRLLHVPLPRGILI